ncbi:MAG: type II toxin-antitoxin system VapC family toxin [Acidimicrobiia bacterium]
MVAVLDASAVLAVALSEIGAPKVAPFLADAWMSAVNHAEVLHGLKRQGIPFLIGEGLVDSLEITVVPFTRRLAGFAAELDAVTSVAGLSLGDRACLATGEAMSCPVVTADRVWTSLGLDIEVISIR